MFWMLAGSGLAAFGSSPLSTLGLREQSTGQGLGHGALNAYNNGISDSDATPEIHPITQFYYKIEPQWWIERTIEIRPNGSRLRNRWPWKPVP